MKISIVGLEKDQGKSSLNKPILCKLPCPSAKNSYKAFREGGADRALVKTVNLVNPTSGTTKLPSQPTSPSPGEFTISFRMGSSHPPQLHLTQRAEHTPTTESECKRRVFFFFSSDYGIRGFLLIKGKAFPTSHQAEGCQWFPRGPQSEGRDFHIPGTR